MLRKILTYPNPILRKKSEPVVDFDDELRTLLDDMYETMITKSGVGLAAVQVGVLKNILLINLPNDDEEGLQEKKNLIEAINPVLKQKDGEILFKEGCLSIPKFYAEVKRPSDIVVEFYDRFGSKQSMEASGFLAVVWQHEMEHLIGHLFIEKLSFNKRQKFEKDYKKMQKVKKTS